jgi:drug/metabolite transporter (DMT)-like permease
LLVIPAFIVLLFTDFFSTFEYTETKMNALGYLAILAVLGTGVAKVFYNKMVHLASPIFASSVTYLIPIVAVFWGILDGEKLDLIQFFAGVIILFGVYLVNKKK